MLKKKLIALSLVGVLSLSLVACGDKEVKDSKSKNNTAEKTEEDIVDIDDIVIEDKGTVEDEVEESNWGGSELARDYRDCLDLIQGYDDRDSFRFDYKDAHIFYPEWGGYEHKFEESDYHKERVISFTVKKKDSYAREYEEKYYLYVHASELYNNGDEDIRSHMQSVVEPSRDAAISALIDRGELGYFKKDGFQYDKTYSECKALGGKGYQFSGTTNADEADHAYNYYGLGGRLYDEQVYLEVMVFSYKLEPEEVELLARSIFGTADTNTIWTSR